MPTLQIRDLDDAVYQRLQAQAQKARRSLAGQASAILEEKLVGGGGKKEARRALLLLIAKQTDAWPEDLPSPDLLLREDRDR